MLSIERYNCICFLLMVQHLVHASLAQVHNCTSKLNNLNIYFSNANDPAISAHVKFKSGSISSFGNLQ